MDGHTHTHKHTHTHTHTHTPTIATAFKSLRTSVAVSVSCAGAALPNVTRCVALDAFMRPRLVDARLPSRTRVCLALVNVNTLAAVKRVVPLLAGTTMCGAATNTPALTRCVTGQALVRASSVVAVRVWLVATWGLAISSALYTEQMPGRS